MDFSVYGVKEGVAKAVKVALYVAASGAVSAIIAYVKDIDVDETQVAAVGALLIVNALLAGVEKWLTTKAPLKKKR